MGVRLIGEPIPDDDTMRAKIKAADTREERKRRRKPPPKRLGREPLDGATRGANGVRTLGDAVAVT
jgi:hypothetical protein